MPSLTSKYVRGTVVNVETTFSVRTGVDLNGNPIYALTDPTTVTFYTEAPDGTETEYVFGTDAEVVKDAVGIYHAEILPDAKGKWLYRWEGTGAATGADEGDFLIIDTLQDTLSFLIIPEDWDSIRAVLGVTELDLEDEHLERPMFAGQAELRIKNRLADWAEINEDPDRAFVLRMAAGYATAALVAESYARGGTIDNVAPNNDAGGGATHGWSTHARLLWSRHEEWMAIAEAWDLDPSDIFDLHAMHASGPTKAHAREAEGRKVPGWATALGVYWDGWTL